MLVLSDVVDIEAPMPKHKWCNQQVGGRQAARAGGWGGANAVLALKHVHHLTPQVLRNYSIVRKLDGHAWPVGFEDAVAAKNASPWGQAHGGAMWLAQASERALLMQLLERLKKLDADVLVRGGRICGGGPWFWWWRWSWCSRSCWSG